MFCVWIARDATGQILDEFSGLWTSEMWEGQKQSHEFYMVQEMWAQIYSRSDYHEGKSTRFHTSLGFPRKWAVKAGSIRVLPGSMLESERVRKKHPDCCCIRRGRERLTPFSVFDKTLGALMAEYQNIIMGFIVSGETEREEKGERERKRTKETQKLTDAWNWPDKQL